MQVVVDGLLTRYELAGEGRLVVLLHGWGDDLRTFTQLQNELTKKYRVLAIDLPGFGGTQPPTEIWSLDNYAAFIKNALKKLELQKIYALIGHSNGGAIAIRAISLDLVQPEKLVLLTAAGIRTRGSGKRLALKAVAKAGNAATIWLPERKRQALRKSLYGVAGSDEGVAPQLRETFRKVVRQDVQADAAELSLPTLLIYAAGDQAVPLSDGKRYHQLIKNSQLQIIPEAGHFVHHDHPAVVQHDIEEFLK